MIELIVVNKCICEQCEFAWLPRIEELPETCPNCRNKQWNKSGIIVDTTKEEEEETKCDDELISVNTSLRNNK